VAHIHGGEITLGAIDDALRHSITKLSHLHFVATEAYGLRVLQLGEEPWRITVCGAPSLDNLLTVSLLTTEQIESLYGVRMEQAPLLVTFHPVTLEYEQTEWQVGELLAALEATGLPTVFTSPNADTCGKTVARMISDYVRVRSTASLVQNLGTQGYLSMMALAAAMVGNSSSGIVEAASLRVPVVNVGTRQSGRIRPANVIDTGYGREEIGEAIRQALRPEFRARLANLVNPYGCGHAARKIADRLRDVSLDSKLIMKRFYDVPLAKVN
jgi:UDP-hydrolysing UDP-N-acetyl-D-glucosamine 2-epimerase